jgi:hypothetical protein
MADSALRVSHLQHDTDGCGAQPCSHPDHDGERTECCGVAYTAPCRAWCVNAAEPMDDDCADCGHAIDFHSMRDDYGSPCARSCETCAASVTMAARAAARDIRPAIVGGIPR